MRLGLNRVGSLAALVFAVAFGASVPASAQTQVQNPPKYRVWNQDNDAPACSGKEKSMVVYRPGRPEDAPGKYPVHVFLTGTGGNYNEEPAHEILELTAAKGYLSASVQYDNSQVDMLLRYSCQSLNNRSKCIFDGPESALGKICAMPEADCSRGVIVSGVSQGAGVIAFAKNHDDRVRGALAMSVGDSMTVRLWGIPILTVSWASCMGGVSSRVIDSGDIRVITGENDELFTSSTKPIRPQLERLTAYRAANGSETTLNCQTQDCTEANPAESGGYYVVSAADLGMGEGGKAKHCFMKENNACNAPTFNTNYRCGTAPWTLRGSYEWLATKGNSDFDAEALSEGFDDDCP